MIVSVNWLRDFVEGLPAADELAHRLTMAGLEVEGIERRQAVPAGVITARIDAIEPHPNADRLHLCRVSDGSRSFRVVCGAPNVELGRIAPLALPGTTLTGGVTLSETTIRGQLSQGMLCSRKELGLGEEADGIWLLPPGVALGVALSDALNLTDTILTIGITPNRGDCLSILGVAREAAAVCGGRVSTPEIALTETGPPIDQVTSVTLEAPAGCPRYCARWIDGIRIGPSPDWLRRRLEAVGLRSINNIVDVTNYVMMELGQPLHAFDFDRLRGGRIVVRWARSGDRFTTLDGAHHTLFDDTLMICDGEGPVAVAGIMGGLDSEIIAGTSRVLIESAYFDPTCIRHGSKKLGLRSESSYRFERGIDYGGCRRAVNRAAQLMLQLAGGTLATGAIDQYPNPIEPPPIRLRTARVNRFLGLDLSAEAMTKTLAAIELRVVEQSAAELQVVPPTFRPDLSREVDLAEEIARLVGYDQVPVTYPRTRIHSQPTDAHWNTRRETKELMRALGFTEILTYSFIARGALEPLGLAAADPRLNPIPLRNPLSEEQAVMRTSLVPGILNTAARNLDFGNGDLKLFELSKIFLPQPGAPLPREQFDLVGLMCGRRDSRLLYGGEEKIGYADIKGALEAVLELLRPERVEFKLDSIPPYLEPADAARAVIAGTTVGWLGRVRIDIAEALDFKDPIYLFELNFDQAFGGRPALRRFQPLPRFPAVLRDMALILDQGIAVQQPLDFITAQSPPFLEAAQVFDIYSGKPLPAGKKSVGYRLVYRAPDRNLTDEEVNRIHGALTGQALEAFQAELR